MRLVRWLAERSPEIVLLFIAAGILSGLWSLYTTGAFA